MASSYPGSLDAFDSIASDKKTSDVVGGRTHRDMHNDLGDAIEAVQAELGTNPSGSDATVAARLTAIEAGTNLGTGSVTSAKIADDTIVNADINSAAAIARSKISGLPTSSTDNTIVRFDSTAGAMQTSGVVIDDNNRLTVATGATGGYGFASGAVHLSGTGSPEGVVPASPGSTWLDTSSTLDTKGWLRYVKATGTGNTGWVAGPEADTGWRNVSGSVENSWTATTLRVRRFGSSVHLQGLMDGTSASSSQCLTLPAGFLPKTGLQIAAPRSGSMSDGIVCEVTTTGIVRLYSGNGKGATQYMNAVFQVATDAWPTSLPGSAA